MRVFSFFFPLYQVFKVWRVSSHTYTYRLSRVHLFATSRTVATRFLNPWNSPGKNTGVGCCFLLQGIFSAQELNLHLLLLLRWQVCSLLLSNQGSPFPILNITNRPWPLLPALCQTAQISVVFPREENIFSTHCAYLQPYVGSAINGLKFWIKVYKVKFLLKKKDISSIIQIYEKTRPF